MDVKWTKNAEANYQMIYFNNDYSEGCLPQILDRLAVTNMQQTPGYGTDEYCKSAAQKIKALCQRDDIAVHFLVGGTQTNLTVVAAALRPHQAVVAAATGHVSIHETGAIEATGHKVLELPGTDGKLTADQIEAVARSQSETMDAEHTVQPKLVYISSPTELGTIYTLEELQAIRNVCDAYGLYLFADGARMGYGLAAKDNDVYLPDFARLCDVFYIGGTKVGALFGEAVVIANPAIAADFRYLIKQRGGMLAKGRLLGLQFDVLMRDGLYLTIAQKANAHAETIRQALKKSGCDFMVENTTNQLFPILPDRVLEELEKEFCFSQMGRVDESHSAIRICTSWATTQENVDALCTKLKMLF